MNKLIPAIAFVSSIFAFAVACGSESSNGEGASSSSSGGSSSGFVGSTSSGGGSGGPIEAGGCQVQTIGFNEGTVVQSLPRASEGDGGVKWTDLDNAKSTDKAFAKVVLAAGQESEELRVTGFNFKLPAGAVFQGVTVQVDRQAPDDGILDGAIALSGVKNQVGRGKYIATAWPTTIVGVHHYGQPTDTWGMDLNPPDVETTDFGASIWVKRNPDGSGPANATALLDSIKIQVAYCLN